MIKRLLLAIILIYTSINAFSQKKISLSQAINVAGKQRMLGQRMAKNRIYIESNINKSFAKVELKKAMDAFEKGLKILRDFAPSKEIKFKVETQDFAYRIGYQNIVTASDDKTLEQMLEYNTLFLKICDDTVKSLVAYSRENKNPNFTKNQQYIYEKVAEATSVSGKLRYLTQRLNLYYAIHVKEYQNITSKEMNAIVGALDSNLEYLTLLEFNTLEIDDSLSEVIYYWDKLKKVVYRKGIVSNQKRKISLEELYTLCNKVLSKANDTTKLYADLGK